MATVLAVAGAFAARHVVAREERKLLDNRAREVAALVTSATDNSRSYLLVLGSLGTPDPNPASFARAVGALAQPTSTEVAVAERRGGIWTLIAHVGPGPGLGAALDDGRASIVDQAAASGGLVTGLWSSVSDRRLIIATAVPGRDGRVAYQSSLIAAGVALPVAQGSPLLGLRAAVFAGDKPDPDTLILSTEGTARIPGRTATVPLAVGVDRWTLLVSAREPLVGGVARWSPLLVLAAGLVAAAAAGGLFQSQVRRREFAQRMVDERTAELRTTQAFLERLLDAAPAVVLRSHWADSGLRVDHASPNIQRIFTIDADEVAAAGSLLPWVHDADRDEFLAAANNLGPSDRGNAELRLRRADGEWGWAWAVIVRESSHSANFLIYLVDITTRRQAEEQLRDAQQDADAANRSKTEFLSRMSHELRTPLNAVLGFAQLLELDPLEPSERESVEQIIRAGRHLLDLINEVLDISRIESGDLRVSLEPIAVPELLADVRALMEPAASQRRLMLTVDAADVYVLADRQRLKQVLLNLLSNAVKYNRPEGTIAVSCRAADSDGAVAIEVADTGPGIAESDMHRLFAPFDRLAAEGSDIEGIGIGLALSRRLAEVMDGTLEARSIPGAGTTLILTLPRTDAETVARETPVAATPQFNGNGELAIPKTVLYVEDNAANVRVVQRVLSLRPNLTVLAASKGEDGFAMARDHRPDLVLLDLHLPDATGEQVLAWLRADSATASIPVVILTADATVGLSRRLRNAGADEFLTKPIDVDGLLRVVDRALA